MKIFKRKIYIIGSRPQIDWQRIFILTIFLTIITSIYSAIFYKKIEKENIAADNPSALIQQNTAKIDDANKTNSNVGQSNSTGNLTGAVVDKTDVNYIIDLYKSKSDRYKKALVDFTQ